MLEEIDSNENEEAENEIFGRKRKTNLSFPLVCIRLVKFLF
jgi:hypothetical protein